MDARRRIKISCGNVERHGPVRARRAASVLLGATALLAVSSVLMASPAIAGESALTASPAIAGGWGGWPGDSGLEEGRRCFPVFAFFFRIVVCQPAPASTTSLSSSADPSRIGQQVVYTAIVSVTPAGIPLGRVEFLDGAQPIAGCGAQPLTLIGPSRATCRVTYGASGSHSITARFLGDFIYPGSTSAALTQTVEPAGKGAQTITFGALTNQRFDQGPIAVTATASSGLPVSLSSTTGAVCTVSGNTVSFIALGTCTLEATQAGNESFSPASPVSRSFIVTPPRGALTALSPAFVPAGEGTSRVAVSPDGKNVYVTNRETTTVWQYSREAATGKLSTLAPMSVAAEDGPEGIAVSPDGRNVYVASKFSDTVSQYSRASLNGALVALSNATVSTGEGPIGVAISPDGKSVYVSNATSGTISEYSRNTTTGALEPLPTATLNAGANVHGIVVSPDGASVYAANYGAGTVSQYSRSATTGELQALTPATVAAGTNPHDLVVSPDSKSVYVADSAATGAVAQFTRGSTGTLTPMPEPTIAAGEDTECIAVSPDGNSVYATNFESGTISEYSREPTSGALTALRPVFTVPTQAGPEGIAVSPEGANVYSTNYHSGTVSQYSRVP
jgi:DNA-binding beta-propeller fold protein YncE